MEGPQDWFKPEVIEKNALAYMAGAVSGVLGFLQAIKSNVIVLGGNAEDRTKVAVLGQEVVELKKDIEALRAENSELRLKIAKLEGGGQG